MFPALAGGFLTTSVTWEAHILIGITFKMSIALGSMDILAMLVLPFNELELFCHLFISSLVSIDIIIVFSV